MSRISILRYSMLTAALAGLFACGSPTPERSVSDVTILANNFRCAFPEKTGKAVWLSDEKDFAATWNQALSGGLNAAPEPPEVDFTRIGVVAVFMGQRPTGGYGLALEPGLLGFEKDLAVLALRYQSPLQGAMTTQVITSPCLFMSLDKQDASRLRIVDQDGRERHLLELR